MALGDAEPPGRRPGGGGGLLGRPVPGRRSAVEEALDRVEKCPAPEMSQSCRPTWPAAAGGVLAPPSAALPGRRPHPSRYPPRSRRSRRSRPSADLSHCRPCAPSSRHCLSAASLAPLPAAEATSPVASTASLAAVFAAPPCRRPRRPRRSRRRWHPWPRHSSPTSPTRGNSPAEVVAASSPRLAHRTLALTRARGGSPRVADILGNPGRRGYAAGAHRRTQSRAGRCSTSPTSKPRCARSAAARLDGSLVLPGCRRIGMWRARCGTA